MVPNMFKKKREISGNSHDNKTKEQGFHISVDTNVAACHIKTHGPKDVISNRFHMTSYPTFGQFLKL